MSRRLLFIEDNVDIRDCFTDLLTASGWSVATAGDGAEALAWLATHEPPALILFDLTMPRCDGYAFRRQQLAHESLARIPAVVFSADLNAEMHRDLFIGLAMVRKDVAFRDLLAVIEQ